jgi:Tol biopolymer transport system component
LAGRPTGWDVPVVRILQTSLGHATGVRGVGLSETTPSLRCQFSSSCPRQKADRALVCTGRPPWGCSHPRDLNRYTFSRLPLIPGGARLGIYEVTALIGEGGMGLVYRARDTKLNRDVALKVLPDSFASDPDRLARFTREAQTLASLNHPNIAHIHGLEESGGVRALVMELVEGDDLSQRIAKGVIPIDDALPIAKQIADALEAAHEQGIIHRDLKPANIKVRSDGTVKVLDFGLAKALDPKSSSATADVTAAITSPAMTHAGMILGTAAYMSPEQARGRTVDKRADIWAFGAVLYEMLTGRSAFADEDVSLTLSKVLRQDPDFDAFPSSVPARVIQAIRVCLRKDPKQRAGDIRDVRLTLEGAFETAAPQTAALAAAAAPRSVVARALPAVAALLVVALGIALWAPWRAEKPVDRPLVRLDVDLGADAAFPTFNYGTSVAISPDGMRLVFASGNRLFTRRLDQPTATELAGTEGAAQPFFSPDGQWVGFAARGKVHKISVEGGPVVPVGDVGGIFAGASWAEDGFIFVGDGGGGKGLLQLPDTGGTAKILAPADGAELQVEPQVLPGGKALVFASGNASSGVDSYTIEVLTRADGRRKVVIRGGQSPRYLASPDGTGHLVYVNKATLFAIPFDLATLEPRGTAVPVLDDVAYGFQMNAGLFAVSRAGTLIYRRARSAAAAMTTMQWISASDGGTSKKAPLPATPGAYHMPRLSPDGQRIAYVISEGANQDIWVFDLQRDARRKLTFGGVNQSPVWSPDGQYIVFEKIGQGLFQARADDASQPQALMLRSIPQLPSSFSPDGKQLAYFEGSRIWALPLQDQGVQLKAGTPEQIIKSTFGDQWPSISPDGRWLAYQSNQSGKFEVYVRAFPPSATSSGGKLVSNNGGTFPHWSRTGQLVYKSADQLMTVSYRVNGPTFIADKPRVWITSLSGTSGFDWDLAPDGKRVVALIPENTAQAAQPEHAIVMLQNFADELRRRVPLGK